MISIQVVGEDSRSPVLPQSPDPSEKPLLLLQPGRRGPLRAARRAGGDMWALSRWGRLCAQVRQELPQAEPLLIGAPGEIALLAAVQRASRQRIRMLAVDLSPSQLDYLQEQAIGLIALDTGTARAVASRGCPTLILCEHGAGLRPPQNAADPLMVLHADHRRGIAGFTVEEVFAAWRDLFSQTIRHSNLFRRE